jgi:hypothetical protein
MLIGSDHAFRAPSTSMMGMLINDRDAHRSCMQIDDLLVFN